jgi:bacillithiol system protein YtxJ
LHIIFIVLAVSGFIAAVFAMFKDPRNIFTYVAAAILALIVLYRNLKVTLNQRKISKMEKLIPVGDEKSIEAALKAEKSVLYKHSSRCPISAKTYEEVIKFAGKNPDIPVYLLQVIEQRSLSDKVADLLKIEHQSPQIFAFRDGQLLWHASHYDITASGLQKTFDQNVK